MSLYVAQPYGNEAIPRGWSKYTRGTSRYLKAHPEETVESEAPKVAGKREEEANVATGTKVLSVEEDAKFREFLAAAQPRHKKKIWANDDDEDALVEDHEQQLQNASQKKIVVKSKKAGGEGLKIRTTQTLQTSCFFPLHPLDFDSHGFSSRSIARSLSQLDLKGFPSSALLLPVCLRAETTRLMLLCFFFGGGGFDGILCRAASDANAHEV